MFTKMKIHKCQSIIIALALSLSMTGSVLAKQMPQSLSTDARMRVVNYDPNNVVRIKGNQLVQTSIQLADYETIVGVEGGDSAAWTISINQNRPNILFIKPTIDASNTNMTVLTDRNTYHFHLLADADETASDRDITYNVKFRYPGVERQVYAARMAEKHRLKETLVSDTPTKPENWNWEYSFSAKCSKALVPIRAFDDGKFTYFQFKGHTETPAIFVVDQRGEESLANVTMKGNYVTVQRIARQFTFRTGDVVSCIFNDKYPR